MALRRIMSPNSGLSGRDIRPQLLALYPCWQVFDILERTVPAVLGSERAARISKVRNRSIAHFNMKSANGEYEMFDPSSAGLEWEDPANFLDETRDIILHIAAVVGRASFDLAEFERMHKWAADDFWSRILGTGPVELELSASEG